MWSVVDWRLDDIYPMLDAAEKGGYRELVDECFIAGFIYSNPQWIQRKTGWTEQQFKSVWPLLAPKFVPLGTDGTLLTSRRLEKDRDRLDDIRKSRQAAGKLGNEKRWQGHEKKARVYKKHARPENVDRKNIANASQTHRKTSQNIANASQTVAITPELPEIQQNGDLKRDGKFKENKDLEKRLSQTSQNIARSQIPDIREGEHIFPSSPDSPNERDIPLLDTLADDTEKRVVGAIPVTVIPVPVEPPTPPPPEAPVLRPIRIDPMVALFEDVFEIYNQGKKYYRKKGDFVQLAAFRKHHNIPQTRAPDDWPQTVANYFASEDSPKKTLGDLVSPDRYPVFSRMTLDRFGREKRVEPAKADENTRRILESTQRFRERILGCDSTGAEPGDAGSAKGNLPARVVGSVDSPT